ncbi:uncharacterized protein EV422DRAFT_500048, partial [Fimicolochytrium jonesii]|uniref:uncharacterized protein n=1 Tax=Fimicolochytrium jonesii TaxID=1396493 RepID=UPI0022FDFCC6
NMPAKINFTEQEERNIALAKEYMRIAYSPEESKGAESVRHLVAENSEMVAPSTFPECKTLLDYADSHRTVMDAVNDLSITSYDYVFAKDNMVLLRYSASGTHKGKPHKDIQPTGRKASWHAAAIFEVEDGKLKKFVKEWDKLLMWTQFGWNRGADLV